MQRAMWRNHGSTTGSLVILTSRLNTSQLNRYIPHPFTCR